MAKDRGRYGSLYSVTYETNEWQRLSLDAAAVFHALKLGRDNNVAGVFPIYRDALSSRSRVPLERVWDALRELEREKWIRMEDSWVWIRNSLLYDPHFSPENGKHVKGLLSVIEGLPHIQLVRDFVSYYRDIGYLPEDFEHVEKAERRGRARQPKGKTVPESIAVHPIDSLSIPESVTETDTEASTETELASSPAREDDAGPPTPATPPERPATGSPAAEGGAVAAPASPNGGPPRATEPPPGDVYRHHGRDYRAGDTLPDGRRVESVEGGVPVILRASAAGAPGELEAAQQALMAEVERAAKALRLPADHALAKFSRTPSGAVIVNPWNCTRLAWIRATTEKLRGARLSVEADTAEASPPAADPDAEFAAYQVIQGHAERYADWCEAKGLPVDHRDSTAAWLAETGLTLTEREGMWLVGERRRVAGRRERAAS